MQSIDDIKLRIEVFSDDSDRCNRMAKQAEYDENYNLANTMYALSENYRIRSDTLRWVLNGSDCKEIFAP